MLIGMHKLAYNVLRQKLTAVDLSANRPAINNLSAMKPLGMAVAFYFFFAVFFFIFSTLRTAVEMCVSYEQQQQ